MIIVKYINYGTMGSEHLQALCDLHGDGNFKVDLCAPLFGLDKHIAEYVENNPQGFIYIDELDYLNLNDSAIKSLIPFCGILRIFCYVHRIEETGYRKKRIAKVRHLSFVKQIERNGTEGMVWSSGEKKFKTGIFGITAIFLQHKPSLLPD